MAGSPTLLNGAGYRVTWSGLSPEFAELLEIPHQSRIVDHHLAALLDDSPVTWWVGNGFVPQAGEPIRKWAIEASP
jgi:hypothetical protein